MFNIVEKRRWFFIFSSALVGLSIAIMVFSAIRFGEPLRMGIDFTGGSRFVLRFAEQVAEDDLREAFASQGIENPVLQRRGEAADNTWQVRTPQVTANEVSSLLDGLEAELGAMDRGALEFDTVEPSVGGEVTKAAGLAILVASLVIVAFMWFSFRRVPNAFRYGVCSIAGMAHNLLITFGFYALMCIVAGWEVDALFLTAILTVIGFSVQDVIVVFDRIRENIPKHRKEPFETVVNRSILETLHRSLATQLCAMFVLVALLLFGGATIKPFIATMLVGMVSETYSAIFISVPLLAEWEQSVIRRAAAQAST